jgi:hypothetical protein
MAGSKIPISDEDQFFRAQVLELLRSAHHHVVVISGELGSYDFPELREAAHAATERGVKIEVYANEPRREVVEHLRGAGAKVAIGDLRAWHHYMVVDDQMVIESLKYGRLGPTKTGTREGVRHGTDPSFAKAILTYLDFLEDVAGRVPTYQVLSEFVREASAQQALVQRIPFAENVYSALGLDSREALAQGKSSFDAFDGALSHIEGGPSAREFATLFANEVALATATAHLHWRQTSSEWNFQMRGSDDPLHPSDARMAREIARARVGETATSSHE